MSFSTFKNFSYYVFNIVFKQFKQKDWVTSLNILAKLQNVGKKFLNNPGRALELAANIGTAAASKNPKLFAATAPDIIKSREGFLFR